MKVFFIVPYPCDNAPSQRFRFEQYLDFLKANNINYEFYSFWSEKDWKLLYQKGKLFNKAIGLIDGFLRRIALMFRLRKADYVFIHREVAPLGPPVFEFIIAKIWRKKIIYDFDDAIWLHNSNLFNKNPLLYLLRWPYKVPTICKWAYKVTCGNQYLCNFALKHNKQVMLIPTTIDTIKAHNRTKDQKTAKVVIGWTGTHSTMPYLHLIEDALRELEEKHDFEFLVISNAPPDLNLRSLTYLPWKIETEIGDLLRINIGLMPSKTDEWAKGKCGFKAIQFMSLGIPVIATAVGVNFDIIKNDYNGYLCSDKSEWVVTMEKLLKDAGLRSEMGDRAKKEIVDIYSVEANKSLYLKVFQ
jgi:glycosyltransferase involved in cell wall biosynthesis